MDVNMMKQGERPGNESDFVTGSEMKTPEKRSLRPILNTSKEFSNMEQFSGEPQPQTGSPKSPRMKKYKNGIAPGAAAIHK